MAKGLSRVMAADAVYGPREPGHEEPPVVSRLAGGAHPSFRMPRKSLSWLLLWGRHAHT